MPQKAKLIRFHEEKGSHLTKKEKEERKSREIDLGDLKFTPPPAVKKDRRASATWRELAKIYIDSGYTIAGSADRRALARYCLLWSEYTDLTERRKVIEDERFPDSELGLILPVDWVNHLVRRARVEPLARIDSTLLRMSAELTRLEDRLFLNPLARIKTIPKKDTKPKEQTPLEQQGFGNL